MEDVGFYGLMGHIASVDGRNLSIGLMIIPGTNRDCIRLSQQERFPYSDRLALPGSGKKLKWDREPTAT